jgi:hypothetical protein
VLKAVVTSALAASVLVLACSNDGPSTISSGGPAAVVDSGTPPGQPRSYRKDVVPILTGSCALVSCHGDRSGNPSVGIFLPLGDPDGIYADLMKESLTAKGAKFVVPSDSANSFLYAKMSGLFAPFAKECPSTGCGDVMPPTGGLNQADIATVKAWIDEGAANN